MKRARKRAVLAVSYLTAAALTFAVLAGVYYERARRFELAVNNSYQHSFDELVTAVEEFDSALQKSVYARSPDLAGILCAEVFGKAMTAQMSLGALPFSSEELEQTSGFISRVGDYAFALSRAAGGRELTEEELGNLKKLSDTASILALNLKGVQTELQAGRLTLGELRRSDETLEEAAPGAAWAGDSIRLIEQEFPEVPALIYDGPFSEHLTGTSPKALEGLPEISAQEARNTAAAFLKVGRGRVVPLGERTGEMPCYEFSVDGEDGDTLYLSLTKQGGRVLSLLSSRPMGTPSVDPETAVETAKRFLEAAGYADMSETYHMTQGGVLTVNYAYRQGEVLCYSDLVKVSVALDTGRVCGFETKGYLSAHHEREIPAVTVDGETARAQVPEELEILGTQLALVPSEGKYETLCHEFKCAAGDGRHYIIYVNAETGRQEKILILLEDESGTLTI